MLESVARARIGLTVALIAGAIASSTARARTPEWTLSWRAPAECPDEAIVRDRVQMWLEQSLERSDPSGMRVEATVRRDGRAFVLDLILASSSGRARESLRSERCDTFASVIALKVSLAADPGTWFRELPPEESSTSPRVGFRFAGSLTGGLFPGAAPALGSTGILRIGPVAVEIGVLYAFGGEAGTLEPPVARAALNAWIGSARFCGLPAIGPVELPICGGVELGTMRAVVSGLPSPSETSLLFVAVALSPGVRLRLVPSVYAFLGLDLLWVLEQPRVLGQPSQILWQSERLAERVQLGVEVRFE